MARLDDLHDDLLNKKTYDFPVCHARLSEGIYEIWFHDGVLGAVLMLGFLTVGLCLAVLAFVGSGSKRRSRHQNGIVFDVGLTWCGCFLGNFLSHQNIF